jgi:hypothetical protein
MAIALQHLFLTNIHENGSLAIVKCKSRCKQHSYNVLYCLLLQCQLSKYDIKLQQKSPICCET